MKQAPEIVDATCSRCRQDGHGTYLTEARCTNCGWEGQMRHSLTHDALEGVRERCPRCECQRLRPGAYVAREETEQSSELRPNSAPDLGATVGFRAKEQHRDG